MARTAAPKITADADGLARCTHHNLHGNVCAACFAATPNLVEVYGQTYRMPAAQIAAERDGWIGEAERAGMAKVSPLTKVAA